jgi:AcrR family transcriptional regulator
MGREPVFLALLLRYNGRGNMRGFALKTSTIFSENLVPMPSTRPSVAQEPKRQRGRDRVAAIIEAGVKLFKEKGFDAATMTEIAAQSGTAIGSLYRFFPSKEALADALLLQYAQLVATELTALETNVSGMSPDEVADALVDFSLSVRPQHSFAISLLEERGGRDEKRVEFRDAMRSHVAKILRRAIPDLGTARSRTMAIVVLHTLKAVTRAETEAPATRTQIFSEIRKLLRVYIASAHD